jgi:hypothetical protein
MSKFYNIRVIEARTRDEAIMLLQNGSATFLENEFLADCVFSFDDLAEIIKNSYY